MNLDLEWRNKDWFDNKESAVSQLLKRKRGLYVSTLQNNLSLQPSTIKEYTESKHILHCELRRMKRFLLKELSIKSILTYFTVSCVVFGLLTSFIIPLRSLDNTIIIKEPEKILQQWQQHFTNLSYNPSVINADVLESLFWCKTKFEMVW